VNGDENWPAVKIKWTLETNPHATQDGRLYAVVPFPPFALSSFNEVPNPAVPSPH
jgi:hypothetical protein